jgi:ABC-type phosphate/phosphonate transport system ATPase subunit
MKSCNNVPAPLGIILTNVLGIFRSISGSLKVILQKIWVGNHVTVLGYEPTGETPFLKMLNRKIAQTFFHAVLL